MQGLKKAKVLFIAGFGPIVRDAAESHRLYVGTLHSLVLATNRGPATCQRRRHGWNLMWRTSQPPRQNLRHKGIACSSAIRRSHGAKP